MRWCKARRHTPFFCRCFPSHFYQLRRPCASCVRKNCECIERACKACSTNGKIAECTHRKPHTLSKLSGRKFLLLFYNSSEISKLLLNRCCNPRHDRRLSIPNFLGGARNQNGTRSRTTISCGTTYVWAPTIFSNGPSIETPWTSTPASTILLPTSANGDFEPIGCFYST